jgi:ribosomal protein S18 acetylase RimI-like enzyme
MNLQLRPAAVEDYPFLQGLYRRAYEVLVTRQYGSWDGDVQRARFDKKLQSVEFKIVLVDSQPVGAVSSTEHADHILLNELLVQPEFQGRGIGSRVLRDVIRHAVQLGKPLRLHTLRMNRAQELYKRHGFIETGRDENYVELERPA